MNRKSSILMLIYYFHPLIGGAERQCLLQAETLLARGHHVSVLTTWHKGLKVHEEINGIQIYRMLFEIPFPILRRLSLFLTNFLFLLFFRNYDLVHVHQFNALTITACLAKCFTGKPVLCKQACEKPYSGFDLIERSRLSGLFHKLIRKLDYLLAISKTTYQEAVDHGFEKQLIFLPNGVRLSRWHWHPGDHTECLFIGRLHQQKGADLFIQAAALDHESAHHYFLLGKGPLRNELETQAGKNVTFCGAVSNPEKYLEQEGACFILPSRAEGLSNSLLEAMARGVPSIASSAVSGSLDLAGEKTADFNGFSVHKNLILIKPEDPEALLHAIQYLSAHPETAIKISEDAIQFIKENYSIDSVCDQLEKVYRKVTERS